jgi:hypothetical protein
MTELIPVFKVCSLNTGGELRSAVAFYSENYGYGKITHRRPECGWLAAFRDAKSAALFVRTTSHRTVELRVFSAVGILAGEQSNKTNGDSYALWFRGFSSYLTMQDLPTGTVLCESIALLPDEWSCWKLNEASYGDATMNSRQPRAP